MQYHETIYGGANPGANLGGAFTASLAERELVAKSVYLDNLVIGLKHDNASSANTAEDSLNILNPFILKANQETRIQLRGRDLVALMAFMYRSLPRIYEADAATDDFKVFGIKVPVFESIKSDVAYSWSAAYSALSNASGGVLSLAANWHDKVLEEKAIVAVEQPYTTAGATGRTDINNVVPQVGEMIGLIVFNTTAPGNTADTGSIQRVQLSINGVKESEYNLISGGQLDGFAFCSQDTPPFDILSPYTFIDLLRDPIDCVNQRVSFGVDVQAASEATRFIPILRK